MILFLHLYNSNNEINYYKKNHIIAPKKIQLHVIGAILHLYKNKNKLFI